MKNGLAKLMDEVYNKVYPYFIKHPKKLQKYSRFKESGMSEDDIKVMLEMQYCFPGRYLDSNSGIAAKYLGRKAVVTDAYNSKTVSRELSKEELWQGEIRAEELHIGCWLVRIALRVYKKTGYGFNSPDDVPGYEKDIERAVNTEASPFKLPVGRVNFSDQDHYVSTEISARLISRPDSDFIYITRATNGKFSSETVSSIFAAKEKASARNDVASLFVCNSYVGDANSSNTWYRLDTTGKVETYYDN